MLVAACLGRRAYVFGCAAALGAGFFCMRGTRMTIHWAVVGLVLLCLLLSVLVLGVKRDSSAGRVLVYKVSAEMLKDHWPAGVGLGRFQVQYLHDQEAFFRKGGHTGKELLLAGNTYYAFNDYFQFVLECGLPGLITLMVLGGGVILLVYRACRRNSAEPALLLAVMGLTVLLSAACFTHVLDRWWCQLIVVVCLAIITYYIVGNSTKKQTVAAVSVLVAGALVISTQWWDDLTERRYLKHWDAGRLAIGAGFVSEAGDQFEQAMAGLSGRGAFPEDYGGVLMRRHRYERAAAVYELAKENRSSNMLFMNLGKCYARLGRCREAESMLLKAVYMVPNRFETRFALFSFYRDTGQWNKMSSCGEAILSLPVKVPSLQVDRIIEVTQDQLQQLYTREE